MRLANIIRLRIRSLLSRRIVERELDEELQYHLDRQIDENLAAGMNSEDARHAALRSISDLEQRKEECRDMRGLNLLDTVSNDVRFAVRQLRRSPGFAVTAILMLGLGVCASVAIFAFVDAALLKPLPYRNSNRLVMAFETHQNCTQCGPSYLDYLDWKKLNRVFRSLDSYRWRTFSVGTATGAQSANGFQVTDGFFRTLGVTPVLGRDFHDGEASLAAPRTTLVSYAAWQQRYGGKSDVVGQTVMLDGDATVIIGVLPREFQFGSAIAEFWPALHPEGSCIERRNCHGMHSIGLLKDDVSIASAQADMRLIAQQLEQQYPVTNRGWGAGIVSLGRVLVEDLRPILFMLWGGAGLLLLIAGVNVASLLLVRSESRKREMAVRTALGASRGRILGQFVTEGLILSLAGGVLGVVSASWAMQILLKLIPPDMLQWWPFLTDFGLNGRVLAYGAIISMLAAILFSLTPAVRLRANNRALAARSSVNVWRGMGSKLVVVELATAVVLLACAGLLGKSLYAMLRTDLGFKADHLVTLQMAAPQSYGATDEKAIAVEQEIIGKMESLPGATSAAVADTLPVLNNWNGGTLIRVLGRPWNGEPNATVEREVSAAYFTTLGARLVRGRYFTRAEEVSKAAVVIINEAFARQYFPGEDPIGKRISYDVGRPLSPIEVIGIVKDIQEGSLDSSSKSTIYTPFIHYVGSYFSIVVRTSLAEQPMVAAMTTALHQINPEIATKGGGTMASLINMSGPTYIHRSSAWLVGAFAALALLLGVIGLYGVVAYSVSQRTREIGIRMALGAESGTVHHLILKEAGLLTLAGIVIGLVCAVAVANLMRGMLFSVSPWDVPTLAAIGMVLGVCALVASYIPARRAAAVNPIEALRTE